MRILHLLAHYPKKLGSIERWSLCLVELARERGHEVLLGFNRLPASTEYLAALEQARVRFLADRPASRADRGFFQRLITFLQLEQIDVVHTHFSPICHFGNLAAWFDNVPGRFWHIHSMSGLHGVSLPSLGHIALQRISARFVLQIFCDSAAIRDDFIRLGLPSDKIIVSPLGIDLGRFSPSRDQEIRIRMRKSFRIPEGVTLIGTVSRAEPIKGLPYLIEAAARVSATRHDVRWLIVGGGSQMRQLQELARRLGVAHQIIFEGIRDDVPEVLQAMDIFVLPSLSEGFPLAAMEAMASSRPVVCSRVGGLPELIRHEESGLLVEPGNVTSLVEGVLRLLSDAAFREQLATGALLQASQYDNRIICNRLFDFYEQTVPITMIRNDRKGGGVASQRQTH